jgi:hypothetical protein
MQVVDVAPVTDTSIYASGDVAFVPIIVPSYRSSDASGPARKLVSVTILDEAAQGVALDLVFSAGTITLGTINAAVSVSDADARKILGIVSVVAADYSALVNSSLATKRAIELIIQPDAVLYLSGIVRSGTPTYAAGSLKIKLGFEDA